MRAAHLLRDGASGNQRHNNVKRPVFIALEAALMLLPRSVRNAGEAGFNLLESVLPQ
jgi:hypothetical protein